ncbi:unnamed protein product, partial [Meganyctiphanes norvegica]
DLKNTHEDTCRLSKGLEEVTVTIDIKNYNLALRKNHDSGHSSLCGEIESLASESSVTEITNGTCMELTNISSTGECPAIATANDTCMELTNIRSSSESTGTITAKNTCDELKQTSRWTTSFFTHVKVLTERNFLVTRPFLLSRLNWFQTVFLALIAGLLWFKVGRTEAELADIQGWMFFSTTYWMLFTLFAALYSFPSEREVIKKERASGSYRVSAYYLAKMIGELPLTVTLPSIYLFISYPMMMGSSTSIYVLLKHLSMLLLNTIVAQSVGLLIGAVYMDLQVGVTVSAIFTLFTQLFGGYLAARISPWLTWAKYLSIIHYAFQNMNIIEFQYGSQVR